MIEHEYLAPGDAVRCVHCGTKQGHHRMVAQPCVPRWGGPDAPRPEPAERTYAYVDIDVIHARITELEAERQAVLNQPTEEAGAPTPPYVDD